MDMPNSNIAWVFLAVVLVGSIVGVLYSDVDAIDEQVAKNTHLLENLPQNVVKNGENIIRICTSLEVDCER